MENLISTLKASYGPKFLLVYDLIKLKVHRTRVPLVANLILTNSCNLKCFYCYVDVFNRTIKEPSTSDWLNLLTELHAMGTRVVILLGGEPLIRRDIGEIIERVNQLGMICEVITNGTLVKKKIESLKHVTSVCLSLDGNQEEHDANRGKGSFDQTIEALNILRENKVPVRIKACVTKNNEKCLDFLAPFVKKHHIILTASPAEIYSDRDYHEKDKWLDRSGMLQFVQKLKTLKTEGVPIGYSYKALNYILNWPYDFDHIINRARTNNSADYPLITCLRKTNSLYIDADGKLYPCAPLWGQGKVDVFKEGFKKAWDSVEEHDCFSCGSLPDVDISLFLGFYWENLIKGAKVALSKA